MGTKHLYMRFIFFTLVALFITGIGCKSKQSVDSKPTMHSNIPTFIHFMDSVDASKSIVKDSKDGFFEKISIADLQIQMKITKPGRKRDDLLAQYKQFLSTEVMNWTPKEKQALYILFDSIRLMCNALNPKLYPSNLALVKIRTNHYGPDVYYTRGNMIMVPENALNVEDFNTLKPVMIHELFHVVSRYQDRLRDSLYGLIGFHPKKFEPSICDDLKERILTNPDGTNLGYTINLGNGIEASTVIYSTSMTYNPKKPRFFEYLHFDLFEYKVKNGLATLECGNDFSSTLAPSSMPNFFNQIKDNTQYIIHPDEIMAENFKIALMTHSSKDREDFSKEGKELLEAVIDVIKRW